MIDSSNYIGRYALMQKRYVFIWIILFGGLIACTSNEPITENDNLAVTEENVVGAAPTTNPTLPTLLELLAEDPNLVFFMNGITSAGLADDLQSDGSFTVFAVSNVAFSEAQLVVSQMEPALVGELMNYHVVDGLFTEADLASAGAVVPLNGEQLPIVQSEEGIQLDYAPIIGEAKVASNGLLYVIDTLLLPPETGPEKSMWGVLREDGRFSSFIAVIAGTEMMADLRFNQKYDAILAPTDAAFANIPADLADYLENSHPDNWQFVAAFHLLAPDGWPQGVDLTTADMVELEMVETRVGLSGSSFAFGFEELPVAQTESGIQIGDALIIEGDMDATNGIVHAIDTVLIPQVLLDHLEE